MKSQNNILYYTLTCYCVLQKQSHYLITLLLACTQTKRHTCQQTTTSTPHPTNISSTNNNHWTFITTTIEWKHSHYICQCVIFILSYIFPLLVLVVLRSSVSRKSVSEIVVGYFVLFIRNKYSRVFNYRYLLPYIYLHITVTIIC